MNELDLQTACLMGLPEHVRGTDWPECPFITSDEYGVFIRWNNNDLVQVYGEPQQGVKDNETVEHWSPSQKIEQAMRLWQQYPPKTQWLQLQLGIDGWTVELLYHHETSVLKKLVGDDYQFSLAEAITRAWITAMEAQA